MSAQNVRLSNGGIIQVGDVAERALYLSVFDSISEQRVLLGEDDARKVRDALTEALNKMNGQQSAYSERKLSQ